MFFLFVQTTTSDLAWFQDDDSKLGADQKTSTRFDHNFSITDFLKINLGTQVALRLVSVL